MVSKISENSDCSHEIKKHLLLGRKAMTNIGSILKSRNITLPTKVQILKAMVSAIVMYRCESWTMKKAECQRIDAFEMCCWRRFLRVLLNSNKVKPVNSKRNQSRRSQDGGGIGQGDHFLSYKFIERTIER